MRSTTLLIFLFLAMSCSNKLSKKLAEDSFIIDQFQPSSINKEIVQGLSIKITPTDASILDSLTFSSALQNDNYQNELFPEFEEARSKNTSLKPRYRDWQIELKGRAFSAVDQLIKQDRISSEDGVRLKWRIWGGPAKGSDGSETQALKQEKYMDNSFNPYYLNSRYLYLFKISIKNTSGKIQKIKSDQFQIIHKEKVISPYELSFFESSLLEKRTKLENIHLLNMPQELTISPSQTITKYIAFPILRDQDDNSTIQINYFNKTETVSFKFNHTSTLTEQTNKFIRYRIPGVRNLPDQTYFFLVSYSDSEKYTLVDNEFFVPEKKLEHEVSLYSVVIKYSEKKSYFGALKNFKFSDYENRKIPLSYTDIEKIK